MLVEDALGTPTSRLRGTVNVTRTWSLQRSAPTKKTVTKVAVRTICAREGQVELGMRRVPRPTDRCPCGRSPTAREGHLLARGCPLGPRGEPSRRQGSWLSLASSLDRSSSRRRRLTVESSRTLRCAS